MLRRRTTAKQNETPNQSKLAERASNLGDDELVKLLEASIASMSSYVPEYRSTRDVAFLGEIRLSAEMAYSLADELFSRGQDSAVKRTRQFLGR
jgi:predicted transcriptional regulator